MSDMMLDEVTQRRRHPCRRMNAVSDVTDRNLFERLARKEFLPKCLRNVAMLAAHAISRATHADRERRQTVTLEFIHRIHAAERKKLFLRQTELSEVVWPKGAKNERGIKLIVAGSNGRVCSKRTLLLYSIDCCRERLLF